MKYFCILLVFFLSNAAFAQNNSTDFKNINFGASKEQTATEAKVAQVITYEIGRMEQQGNFKMFIPKTFSPNGDGINDNFNILSQNVIDFEMKIFDQWGNFVFETHDNLQKWDGSTAQKSIDAGAFIYIIKLKTIAGQSLKFSGCVTMEQ